MQRLVNALLLILLVSGVAGTPVAWPQSGDREVAFINVNVIPMDLADVVQRTKQAGTWIVPTMAVWEVLLGARDLEMLLSYAEIKYMPPQQVEFWRTVYHNRLNRPQYSRKRADQIAADRKRILKALSHERFSSIQRGCRSHSGGGLDADFPLS